MAPISVPRGVAPFRVATPVSHAPSVFDKVPPFRARSGCNMKTATKPRRVVATNETQNNLYPLLLPYSSRKTLLTPGERRFYTTGLLPAVGSRFHVAPKVRLADVITCPGPPSSTAFRKIQSKHLDFVLMYPKSSRIVAAIELNDATHDQAQRQDRDAFVANVLRSAGILLIMVPIFKTYDPAKLRGHIERALR